MAYSIVRLGVALILLAATAAAQAPPLVIARQGYFFVGGKYCDASDGPAYDHCTVAYLRQARVATVRDVRLADIGIKGNGHILMLEKNNLDVAAVAEKWLHESVD